MKVGQFPPIQIQLLKTFWMMMIGRAGATAEGFDCRSGERYALSREVVAEATLVQEVDAEAAPGREVARSRKTFLHRFAFDSRVRGLKIQIWVSLCSVGLRG